MGSSGSTCASPALSISTAYDQFSLNIKYEEEWKDNNIYGGSVCSPGGPIANPSGSSNNFSTSSMTFTEPPHPINVQSPFVNGNVTPQPSVTASMTNEFHGSANNSTLSMQSNSGYFGANNSAFASDNQNGFGTECHCKTGYTCSKCFQKAMEM